jgi:hypothetical protein
MPSMAMNSEAPSKHGGNGGGELEKRVTGIETRLGVIGKTMVTAEVLQRELGALRKEMHAEFVALRVEIARMPFETINWLLAVFGIAAAITTTVYSIWFR